MPGSTTELNLATAVDSDDNADYLTLSLANSLRTVDALFNSITGHNHGGAHQGGAIAAAAIPGGSITNAMLGADVARTNLLTNGGFEIWQRGGGPLTGGAAFTADRWQIALAAGDTLSVSQNSANADSASQYCAACVYTRSAGATALQHIGGASIDLTPVVRGKTVSFSVRVRTSTASAVRLKINDGVTGAQTGAYHSGGGAYETLTLTYVVASNASAVNASVEFNASCTAYLDNAMLVVGSQAANYAPLPPADDLARCLRYYEVIGQGWGNVSVNGYQAASQTLSVYVPFKALKPINPTITKNGTWVVANCGQPSVIANSAASDGVSIGTTVIALAATGFANNATGANFTVEANP